MEFQTRGHKISNYVDEFCSHFVFPTTKVLFEKAYDTEIVHGFLSEFQSKSWPVAVSILTINILIDLEEKSCFYYDFSFNFLQFNYSNILLRDFKLLLGNLLHTRADISPYWMQMSVRNGK